jgi:hypothetical protein
MLLGAYFWYSSRARQLKPHHDDIDVRGRVAIAELNPATQLTKWLRDDRQ